MNTYGYVGGTPLRYSDSTGECPWCIGAVIGGISGAIGALNDPCATTQDILQAAAVGALVGGVTALVPIGGGLAASIIRNALAGAGGNAAGQTLTNGIGNVSVGQVAVQGAIGGLSGGVGNVVGLSESLAALAARVTAQQAIEIGTGVGGTAALEIGTSVNALLPLSLGGFGSTSNAGANCGCKK